MTRSGEEWLFDEGRRLRCRVLENVETWGQTVVRVWYPEIQTVLLVSPERLKPIEAFRISDAEISYVAAAARVADALQ